MTATFRRNDTKMKMEMNMEITLYNNNETTHMWRLGVVHSARLQCCLEVRHWGVVG